MSIPAIVLAGGASSRMGAPKALLTTGRETFLARIVGTLSASAVDGITVVTGVHHDAIRAEVDAWSSRWRVQVVRNGDPAADQLSSLRCGLDAVDGDEVGAVLVALVDHPFVSRSTVAALLRGFVETRAPVTRPAFQGRHGHPVVFARETFGALRAAPPGEGAKGVVQAFASRVLNVDVDDEGVWTDIDTPDAYRSALARFARAEP